jgi:hypothetical protein
VKLWRCVEDFTEGVDGVRILKGQVFAADEVWELPLPDYNLTGENLMVYWKEIR